MIIGFTGSRNGMNEKQKKQFKVLLTELAGTEFRHGDCVGADSQAHDYAASTEMKIVIHPPTVNKNRAHKVADEVLPAKAYLSRNKDIVKASDLMIACPSSSNAASRSGTWATIRFTQKSGKKLHILHP